MSQQAAKRRRSQWANGHRHLARLGGNRCAPRPIYSKSDLGSISAAIERERAAMRAEQRRKANAKAKKK